MKKIIADEMYIDVERLPDDAVLMEHPEMDSLVLPEILMALEDAGYVVPGKVDIPRNCTVKDFVKLVEDLNAA